MAHKIVILGEGGVGKSCVTIQLCHYYFEADYDPTIENSYRKQMTVDDESCVLDIRDTAGQDDYLAIRDQHIQHGNGFALVYSITSRRTFESITELYDSIERVKEVDDFPVVIIGNKLDMEKEREVSTKEGKECAKRIKASFFETSAKLRVNVDEAFVELVRNVRKWEKEHLEPKKKKHRGCLII